MLGAPSGIADRHHGIELCRALVTRIFLWQGGLLGLLGALGGCGAGAMLGRVFEGLAVNADGTPKFPVDQSPALFAATVAGSVAVGLAAAVWPARRAAKLDPVVAIRSA